MAQPEGALPPGASRIVVLAGSAGAIPPLRGIIRALPADLPAAVVVVQHRPPVQPSHLGALLRRDTRLPVREPASGDPVQAGVIYLCAPDRSTRLGPDGCFHVAEALDARRPRPRADPVLRSVARLTGRRAVAVVLSGYGRDGAEGAAEVHRHGGTVLVQDPSTCELAGMPEAVLGGCGADFVLAPESIGSAVTTLVSAASVAAALFGTPDVRWRFRGVGVLS